MWCFLAHINLTLWMQVWWTKMPKLMKFSLRNFLTFFAGQTHRNRRSLQVAEMRSESVVVAKRLSIDTELPVSERETHNQLSSYTSLRDLMLASRPISPIKQKREISRTAERELEEDDPHWPGGGARPPIKNRLVEQAARAYLLPAGAQTAPSEQFFARYWAKLTSSGSLHVRPSTEDLYTPVHHDSGHLDSHFECGFSCLPSFLWVSFTHIFSCLFSNVRPQSVGFLSA